MSAYSTALRRFECAQRSFRANANAWTYIKLKRALCQLRNARGQHDVSMRGCRAK